MGSRICSTSGVRGGLRHGQGHGPAERLSVVDPAAALVVDPTSDDGVAVVSSVARRLSVSVSAWIRRRMKSRATATFRRSRANLDAVMGVRTSRSSATPRTRMLNASFSRAPGRSVDWPGPPPAEWRRRMYEDYLD